MEEAKGKLEIYSMQDEINEELAKILNKESEPVFGFIDIKRRKEEKDKGILKTSFSCALRSYDTVEIFMEDFAKLWLGAYVQSGNVEMLKNNKWAIAFVYKNKGYIVSHEAGEPFDNLPLEMENC